jgi:hypothetical protein
VAEPKKGWFDIVKYVWKSMFRHEYQDTYRNRVLQVSSNVFLHLHPTKIRRHALRLRFTWCMGGITFLLFLILTVTGVILMFYYRPTGEYAYHDMKYLQFDVPFGMIMRNMHRWGAHAMVIAVWLHMFRVFMTGSYKPPREFNWVDLGRHGGYQHGAGHASSRARRAVRRFPRSQRPLRCTRALDGRPLGRRGDVAPVLRAALYLHSDHCGGADDRALLAGS